MKKALHSSDSINCSSFDCNFLQGPLIEQILILDLIYNIHAFNYPAEHNIGSIHEG